MLATFLAVHREAGFSSAAQKLHRTQPAISQRIRQLEGELGVPLFERARGAPKLSQAGMVLLPYAEQVIAALNDAQTAVRALATEDEGPIAIAVVGTLAGTALTTTLKSFLKLRPKVELSLSTATSAGVSELVRRGEATIGLRYFPDTANDLACIPLGKESLAVVCAAEHPLAGRILRQLATLKAEHWFDFPVAPGRREPSAQNVLVHFRARGITEISWTAVDSLTAQKRLVELGLGLALIPESAIAEEIAANTMGRIAVADLKAANPVFAVVRRHGYLSAAARRLIEVLKVQPMKSSTNARGRKRVR